MIISVKFHLQFDLHALSCGSCMYLTGHFTIIEPQNPSINVSELHRVCQSMHLRV